MTDPETVDKLLEKMRRYEKRLDAGQHSPVVLEQLRKRIVMLRDEIKLARWHESQQKIRIKTGEMKCGED